METPPSHPYAILHGGPTCDNLLWLDLELTGLDFSKDLILEIAGLVTDRDLHPLEGFSRIIHYEEHDLKQMDAWSKQQHGMESDLLQQVRNSTVSLSQAAQEFKDFVDRWRGNKKILLAGSSVHHDKLFLQYQMPQLVECLHYRTVDVSSIMELAKRWYPHLHRHGPKPTRSHRAMDDIQSSLTLLRFYRDHFFVHVRQHASASYRKTHPPSPASINFLV